MVLLLWAALAAGPQGTDVEARIAALEKENAALRAAVAELQAKAAADASNARLSYIPPPTSSATWGGQRYLAPTGPLFVPSADCADGHCGPAAFYGAPAFAGGGGPGGFYGPSGGFSGGGDCGPGGCRPARRGLFGRRR